MATQIMPFQVPTSLAGTLAAYEERRKSLQNTPSQYKSAQPSSHFEQIQIPSPEAIYQRSLPSLHFLRWRPLYHMQAPSGWMNDPCAPGYDPSTGLYHLFFQWNPKRNEYGAIAWGNISWGHATSKDMINWTVDSKAVLKPGSWYDKEGCFTGCFVPSGLDGNKGITLFYTGVSRLPLHYSLPYKNSTETLAIACLTSNHQWRKMNSNPALPEPPNGIDVTGWRDPYVARWPSMDRLLGNAEGQTLYAFISGGIRERTPTAFLYAINPQNLTEWVFLNSLVNVGVNHNISRWSGDLGINWECANFMTLTSPVDGSSREFIVVGGEGSDMTHPLSTFTEYPQQLTKFPRSERSLQWMCGKLEVKEGNNGKVLPHMSYVSGGKFDHALMYGVNTFYDPKSQRQIAYGWITEEDLPQRLVDRMNWSGLMSIPRELSLICIQNVVGALRSKLKEITSLEIEPTSDDAFIIRTLGISPAQCLEDLHRGARHLQLTEPVALQDEIFPTLDVQTCRFELAAAFSVSDHCEQVGMSIYHSQDQSEEHATSISLVTETETLTVNRPDSTQVDPEIYSYPEKAPFTLFSIRQPDGGIGRERFEIRAFFDESVLEIFANDRCTFATRVYPATKRCWGVKFWAQDQSGQTRLLSAKVWDGLRAELMVS